MPSNSPRQKTILFFPLNSPGHINSSLGLADRIKHEFNHRTVFLVLGKMLSNCVRDHGHELVNLDEVSPYEDYEIEKDEDPSELDEASKLREGKTKRKFEGAYKWPQILMRNQKVIRLEPVEAFIQSCTLMEKLMVGELVDNHDNYSKAIESISPDMIIIDAYYVPPCILNLPAHIPWVRLYSANPLMLCDSKLPDHLKPAPMCGFQLFDKQERERLRNEEPQKWQSMLDEWTQASERVLEAMGQAGGLLHDFLHRHKCPPVPRGKQAHDSPHLNIYMFPQALDYDQDDDLFEYPKRWFRSDSMVRSANQARLSAQAERANEMWLNELSMASSDKSHVVLFSLGSLASGDCWLIERFVRILAEDEQRLYVVSKGVNGDQVELSERNMIGDKYIPQLVTLERADLAIIHGGNNSITECMYFGVPMIVLPVFADQLDNAQRVQDLGLGRRLNVHTCSREELLTAIEEILNNRKLIERVRSIGEAMRANEDLAKISLMLNKLVTQQSLEQIFIDKCRTQSIKEIEF